MKGMNILPVGCERKVLKIYFKQPLKNPALTIPPLHHSGSSARASSSLHHMRKLSLFNACFRLLTT